MCMYMYVCSYIYIPVSLVFLLDFLVLLSFCFVSKNICGDFCGTGYRPLELAITNKLKYLEQCSQHDSQLFV